MKFFFSACFFALVGTNLSAQNPVPDPPPIQVMVLGTFILEIRGWTCTT
jgi:hypothetical protein